VTSVGYSFIVFLISRHLVPEVPSKAFLISRDRSRYPEIKAYLWGHTGQTGRNTRLALRESGLCMESRDIGNILDGLAP
jgi:hypothetical protein